MTDALSIADDLVATADPSGIEAHDVEAFPYLRLPVAWSPMGLRGMLRRLSTPVEELDREQLREFCQRQADVMPIAAVKARERATVVGEVMSVRMVPKAGTPWLEVTVSDGRDRMVAMWTGRRRLAGVEPGRRLVLAGRASATGPGGRMLLMNPRYELLPSGAAELG